MARNALAWSALLFLVPAIPVQAEILKGVLSIKGAEMS